jgi:hypothetical protein
MMGKQEQTSKKLSPRGGASALPSTKRRKGGKKAPKTAVQGKGGRPTKYSDEIIEAICSKLSKGIPLAAICREEGMPGVQTVMDWQSSKPGVSVAIARAREVGEDTIAVECLDIADQKPGISPSTGGVDAGDVQNRKLRIETRLKLLAKWNPKKWGEKVDVTSDGQQIGKTEVILPHVPTGGPAV